VKLIDFDFDVDCCGKKWNWNVD